MRHLYRKLLPLMAALLPFTAQAQSDKYPSSAFLGGTSSQTTFAGFNLVGINWGTKPIGQGTIESVSGTLVYCDVNNRFEDAATVGDSAYLEIASGPAEGSMVMVTVNGNNSFVTPYAMSNILNEEFVLRTPATPGDYFGAITPSIGLVATSTTDRLWTYNTQSSPLVLFINSAGVWKDVNDPFGPDYDDYALSPIRAAYVEVMAGNEGYVIETAGLHRRYDILVEADGGWNYVSLPLAFWDDVFDNTWLNTNFSVGTYTDVVYGTDDAAGWHTFAQNSSSTWKSTLNFFGSSTYDFPTKTGSVMPAYTVTPNAVVIDKKDQVNPDTNKVIPTWVDDLANYLPFNP